jgi:hypothetical protein
MWCIACLAQQTVSRARARDGLPDGSKGEQGGLPWTSNPRTGEVAPIARSGAITRRPSAREEGERHRALCRLGVRISISVIRTTSLGSLSKAAANRNSVLGDHRVGGQHVK